ncbi:MULTISPECIES: DUF5983 family protein [unclassified Serratia (in: enterobacteria)]|uniref:DUF5983 family protein n=1 Tax=unclassified Serratia (in: enterobacteria) TaxID=2647522 RepID=UPI0030766B07
MKKYTEYAPFGVTAIQLDNGDEAIYLHGECIACADMGQRDDPVIDTGERLATTLGVPFHLLSLPVPDDSEWAWNDVVATLGWGKSVTLPRMVIRPVLECSTSHITEDDNILLAELSREKFEGEWIVNTGVGYLIRLEARMHPLKHLKRFGLSRTSRRLIIQSMRQADISMIHFSLVGEELPNFETFDW